MNGKLIDSFRFLPRTVGYTYTDLPSYISMVKSLVNHHNEHTKHNYDIYKHITNHSQITQIYTNLHKNK